MSPSSNVTTTKVLGIVLREVAGGRLGVKQELGLKHENLVVQEDSSAGLAAATWGKVPT